MADCGLPFRRIAPAPVRRIEDTELASRVADVVYVADAPNATRRNTIHAVDQLQMAAKTTINRLPEGLSQSVAVSTPAATFTRRTRVLEAISRETDNHQGSGSNRLIGPLRITDTPMTKRPQLLCNRRS